MNFQVKKLEKEQLKHNWKEYRRKNSKDKTFSDF